MAYEENNYREVLFGFLFCLVVFYVVFSVRYYKEEKLATAQNYSIATVTGFGDYDVYFSFTIGKIIINGETCIPSLPQGFIYKLKRGERYIVKFVREYPYFSELLFEYSVPDCVKESPKEGWEGIPDFSKLCK